MPSTSLAWGTKHLAISTHHNCSRGFPGKYKTWRMKNLREAASSLAQCFGELTWWNTSTPSSVQQDMSYQWACAWHEPKDSGDTDPHPSVAQPPSLTGGGPQTCRAHFWTPLQPVARWGRSWAQCTKAKAISLLGVASNQQNWTGPTFKSLSSGRAILLSNL